jgi:hypothetical protein
MTNLDEVRQQLELAFARYMRLDDAEQHAAMDMAVLLLRQMLRKQSGRRERLAELGTSKQHTTTRKTGSHVEKTRSALVRKSNAASPKAPLKPVQTTKKNELRRT